MTDPSTGFEVFVDRLADAGIRTVFGLMGDDTAALISDLPRRGIAYRSARHENMAVAMADGYEWATQTTGVAIISRGPGLTNAMTALASIARRRARVIVVVGDAPATNVGGQSGRTDHKASDQVSIAAAAGINVVRVTDPREVRSGVDHALTAAAAGIATLLIIPSDIQAATAPQLDTVPAESFTTSAAEPVDAQLDRAASILNASTAPLILAGHGAHLSGAAPALRALAERTGALLGTTLLGIGMFHDDPFSVGIIGGFATETALALVAQADVVLVVGASLSTFTTEHGRLLAHATLIQVDNDPDSIGTRLPAHPVIGDARRVADALLPRLDARTTPYRSEETSTRISAAAGRDGTIATSSRGLNPDDVMRRLDQLLPKQRVVITDGGHNLGYPPMYLAVQGPDHYRHSFSFGAVGMGLGVALGAAVAGRNGPVVLVVGDGGLSMTLGDLSTAVEYSIPIVIVVFNDRAYGAERHFLDLIGRPADLALFAEIDFAAVAAALGMHALRVTTPDELEHAAETLARSPLAPVLIDVRIDPDSRARWIDSGMVQGHDGEPEA